MQVSHHLLVVVVVVYFSTNLMVCISSLTTIARHRPAQLLTVIQSFELLFANLPPNFTRAQVSSVRKFLKVYIDISELTILRVVAVLLLLLLLLLFRCSA